MNVLLLGAGASKSYNQSVTGIRMPVAKDFFLTFRKLDIAENPWVLIGMILNYLKTYHKIDFLDFLDYSEDIEVLHSEIQERLAAVLDRQIKHQKYEDTDVVVVSAYNQLIFLFTSVINEIQNGPVSLAHVRLAKSLSANDVIITFNWDTLMDRALSDIGNWSTETGYYVKPKLIYRDQWITNESLVSTEHPFLLKLHGSTNWLTSYMIAEEGKLNSIQT